MGELLHCHHSKLHVCKFIFDIVSVLFIFGNRLIILEVVLILKDELTVQVCLLVVIFDCDYFQVAIGVFREEVVNLGGLVQTPVNASYLVFIFLVFYWVYHSLALGCVLYAVHRAIDVLLLAVCFVINQEFPHVFIVPGNLVKKVVDLDVGEDERILGPVFIPTDPFIGKHKELAFKLGLDLLV